MRFTLLRAFVVVALAANVLFFAWSQGALGFVGLAPATQRDPARLEQQVRPKAMRVLTPAQAAAVTAPAPATAATNAAATTTVGPPLPVAEAASAPAAAVAASGPSTAAPQAAAPAGASACLDIGPLEGNAAIDGVEQALVAVLPTRGWKREQRAAGSEQYAVFVPVLSREAARQRRDELVKLKLAFEAIEIEVPDGKSSAKLGGYALARHDSEAAALAALDSLRERGLRTARVVPMRGPDTPRTWLRLERLTAVQADAVRALAPAQLGGAATSECVIGSVMSVRTPPR
jgi:hypothetical protein